jgi:hypothetical protein
MLATTPNAPLAGVSLQDTSTLMLVAWHLFAANVATCFAFGIG